MGSDPPHSAGKAMVQCFVAPAAVIPVSAYQRCSGAGASPDPSDASLLGALSGPHRFTCRMERLPCMAAINAFFQPVSNVHDYPSGNSNSGRPSTPVLECELHPWHGVVPFSASGPHRSHLDGQGRLCNPTGMARHSGITSFDRPRPLVAFLVRFSMADQRGGLLRDAFRQRPVGETGAAHVGGLSEQLVGGDAVSFDPVAAE